MATEQKITVPSEFAVIDRRGLYMSRFVAIVLMAGSAMAVVASLRVVSAFEGANAVHRARNEASHICIVETIGEGRHLAKSNHDWSPRDAVMFYERCVDEVSRTLVPPKTVNDPLRFQRPDAQLPSPTNPKVSAAPTQGPVGPMGPASPETIYVPVPSTPEPTSAPSQRPSTRPTPRPTTRPTSAPTCDPACLPSPP